MTQVDRSNQTRIFRTLRNLILLPKVTVDAEYKNNNSLINAIHIKHSQEYVPNLVLRWCAVKCYFRVYIHVANTTTEKTSAGYCICNINSGMAAAGLVMIYSFLHKHRSNNKTDAE